MKIYITFGQIHVHSVNGVTFDKDCVAEIEAEDYQKGREIAHSLFKGEFATSYTKEQIEEQLHYFPRGIIKAN